MVNLTEQQNRVYELLIVQKMSPLQIANTLKITRQRVYQHIKILRTLGHIQDSVIRTPRVIHYPIPILTNKRLLHNLFKHNLVKFKRLGYVMTKKKIDLLGCSIKEFKEHIQSKFTNGMTWKNYGRWHIDHIIPQAAIKTNNPELIEKYFYYTNLQPLWADTNMQKSDTLPPSFPMETLSTQDGCIREDKINIVPQEGSFNQSLVGKITQKPIQKRQWQPHNYRLYASFDKATYHPPNHTPTIPPQLDKGWVEVSRFEFKPINHGKEHLYLNWHWCHILIKKSQVCVFYKKLDKQWFNIQYTEPEQYEQFVSNKIAEFKEDCRKALSLFILYFGGKTDYNFREYKNDNSFSGDKVVDKLPGHLRINTELFKKDYKEKLEFKGTGPMINYVFNQSLEPKVPMIIDKLDTLHNEVSIFRESLNSYAIENKRYAKNLQLHISVMEDIKNSIASQSLIYKEMLGTFVAIKQFVKGVGLCKGGKIDKGVQETLNRWK